MTVPTPDFIVNDFKTAGFTEVGAITYVTGHLGGQTAVRGDGATTQLRTTRQVTGTQRFTVSGLFKLDGVQANGSGMINQYHPTAIHRVFTATATTLEQYQLSIRSASFTQRSKLDPVATNDGKYHHFFATMNRVANVNEMRIQIDGKITSYSELDTLAETQVMQNNGTADLQFLYSYVLGHFKGDLDRWRVWDDVALTSEQGIEEANNEGFGLGGRRSTNNRESGIRKLRRVRYGPRAVR